MPKGLERKHVFCASILSFDMLGLTAWAPLAALVSRLRM